MSATSCSTTTTSVTTGSTEFGALIPRGSMSVVVRCDTADGRSAVLKIAPDDRSDVAVARGRRYC